MCGEWMQQGGVGEGGFGGREHNTRSVIHAFLFIEDINSLILPYSDALIVSCFNIFTAIVTAIVNSEAVTIPY